MEGPFLFKFGGLDEYEGFLHVEGLSLTPSLRYQDAQKRLLSL